MAEVRLTAEARTDFGKGAARRLRRDGKVPAVLYGDGEPPRHVSLDGHDLNQALKQPKVILEIDFESDVVPLRRVTSSVTRSRASSSTSTSWHSTVPR